MPNRLDSLTDRQLAVIGAALRYMRANLSDVNECFDADNAGNPMPDGMIAYAGFEMPEFTEDDVNGILGLLGED